MATWTNFFGNNSYSVDSAEAEKKLRQKEPLLLFAKEHVQLAFKSATDPRDKSYLTSHRIILKDGKGLSGKRKTFQSIPYASIKAFSVKTAGSGLDQDTELKVWTDSYVKLKLEFGKGVVNIFAIQQFMNDKCLANKKASAGTQDAVVSNTVNVNVNNTDAPTIMDWLGDNAQQFNPADMQDKLKNQYPVLLKDETVELAFKSGRDFTVFTSRRFLLVDVQGLSGKRVKFMSIPWEQVRGYAIETAGSFLDRDSEFKIFTSVGDGCYEISQDLRKGKADLWAIQTCLNNHILGKDQEMLSQIDQRAGHVDPETTSWWGRSNSRPLDAVEMNRIFHSAPPILQSKEVVEMAFKGIRDIVLFTTKRFLKIDPKGWSGQKVEYTTIPWQNVVAFAVETAGKTLDNDSEVRLWTEMMFQPATGSEDPPEPYMAMIDEDFNKKLVDIIAVKQYLSQRCLNASDALEDVVHLEPNISNTSSEEKGLEKFLSKLGDDQRAIDPTEMNTLFHTELPILLDNENIIMAFKSGRDATFFTNLRVLIMDVQGWSGKKVEYKSIPYKSIRGFSTTSAGSWDRDSEVTLYTRNLWNLGEVSLDFRKGKVDIVMLQKFLSAILLGTNEDIQHYFESTGKMFSNGGDAPGVDSFLSWITSNSVEISADVVSHQLHSDPPILLDDENVEKVYRSGRDMYVYTNLRFLKIDVQGWSGKKVKYRTTPMKWVKSFEVDTAGHMDKDAEVYIQSSIPGMKRMQQDILVTHGDIMQMHAYLTNKLLFPGEREE